MTPSTKTETNLGRITQIIGPVLDVAFAPNKMPNIYNAIVVEGKNLGEKIGFPTANLHIAETYKLIPKTGAYVVKSTINAKEVFGMMNIGFRPTVNGKNQTIEVHFFNFDSRIYDEKIQIEVLKFLREEQKFDSVEALKKQLAKDKKASENYINGILFE